MKLRQRGSADLADFRCLLVEGRHVAEVPLLVGRQVAALGLRSQRLRLGSGAVDLREALALDLIQLIRRETRLLQHLGSQAQHVRQILTSRLESDRHAIGATLHSHCRLEACQLVLQLLAGVLLCAAHQHGRRDPACFAQVLQRLGLAEMQSDHCVYTAAAGLLLQVGDLQGADAAALSVRIDVGRGRVEVLTGLDLLVSRVALQHCAQGGRGGNHGP